MVENWSRSYSRVVDIVGRCLRRADYPGPRRSVILFASVFVVVRSDFGWEIRLEGLKRFWAPLVSHGRRTNMQR